MDVGPASMLVGNLVAGKRIAQATGRELGVVEDQDLIRKVPSDTQTTNHTDPMNRRGISQHGVRKMFHSLSDFFYSLICITVNSHI